MNRAPSANVGFIVWATACVTTGWGLSLIHQLSPAGYAVALPLLLLTFWWLVGHDHGEIVRHGCRLRIFCRRFRRPLPLIFLVVAVLAFSGGAFYAPTNFDALTYRIPRMLNWMAAGQWCWIPTVNQRMNFSGPAWEWTAMPFFMFLHSDRGMFLINALGYLLMPGLLFSIFRRLGVPRRVAWTWMWLVPLAYGYVTQAGSIGNDLTGAIFALLATDFAMRARTSGHIRDVWRALLAAALMTGVKLSNLPLALPVLIALWPPLLGLVKTPRQWPMGLALALICAVVSALPIMGLNQKFTGSWTGDPHNEFEVQLSNPAAAVMGNAFLLAECSCDPPVLPFSKEINARLIASLPSALKEAYPRLRQTSFSEIPGEENSGFGLNTTLPLLLGLGMSLIGLRRANPLKKLPSVLPPVALGAWVAFLFYLAKAGSEAGPRLLLPYYPLAIAPFLLLSPQQRWLRRRAWRVFLLLMALSIFPVLILSVSRPLWPAVTATGWFARNYPRNHFLQRLAETYRGYAHRNDVLAPIRAELPVETHIVGFVAGQNDTPYSLWRPIGTRRVVDLRADKNDFLAHPGKVEWVVIKEKYWPEVSSVPLPTWAAEHHAKIVAEIPIVELISWGPEKWCVLRFEPKPKN